MGEEEVKKTEEKKQKEKVQEEEKKGEKVPEVAADDKKAEPAAAEEQTPPPPPPPPQEIVLKVFMHCEGCARKVRRCLKGFDGVEEVITDCKTSKVVVKGEKAAADPLKVLERVQRKSHRQVELISPIPKPPSEEETKKPVEKEVVKTEDKIQEEIPITVVLGVYMHCEACAQEIKKRIQKMKGVENAEPELKSSQVTVKGVFETGKLIDHVYKRTGKHAVIIKVVEPEKKEEEKGKEEKKPEEEGDKEVKKVEDVKENKEGAADAPAPATPGDEPPPKPEGDGDDQKMEMKKNEFYYYHPQNYQIYPPQRFVQDMYASYPPAPQMFSDENPNACSVM